MITGAHGLSTGSDSGRRARIGSRKFLPSGIGPEMFLSRVANTTTVGHAGAVPDKVPTRGSQQDQCVYVVRAAWRREAKRRLLARQGLRMTRHLVIQRLIPGFGNLIAGHD